jgi:hypothetical protein
MLLVPQEGSTDFAEYSYSKWAVLTNCLADLPPSHMQLIRNVSRISFRLALQVLQLHKILTTCQTVICQGWFNSDVMIYRVMPDE